MMLDDTEGERGDGGGSGLKGRFLTTILPNSLRGANKEKGGRE